MKILHLLASSLGGGASHVFDLIIHKTSGIEQRLVVSSDGGTIADQLRAVGTEVDEIDMAKGWKWASLVGLIRIMRNDQPEVVHCHGFRAGLYGRIAAKVASRRIKIVLTVHGFHYFYYHNRWKKKAFMLLEKIFRPFTDHVIAVSNTDWQHLADCKLIHKKRSRVIFNGISPLAKTMWGKEEIRSRLDLSNREQPIIATVARLHYQKGVIYFLEAVPLILQSYPQACFLIVGDGPERESLMRAAQDLKKLNNLNRP